MKRILAVGMVFGALVLGGCSGKGGQELFETAQFEEKQHNLEHARTLYGEIVAKYPQSEFAAKAKERLEALKAGK